VDYRGILEVVSSVKKDYEQKQTKKTMILDALLLYTLVTGIVQFLYVVFVGTFPFNSFLSSFICHVGLFALGVSLRLQLTGRDGDFKATSPERAFADFSFCALVLFFVVVSFMG